MPASSRSGDLTATATIKVGAARPITEHPVRSRVAAPVSPLRSVLLRRRCMMTIPKLARSATTAPPVIAIDPDAPRSDLHLHAAMTWPLDPRAREEAVAVAAAYGLEGIEKGCHERVVAEVERALSEAAAARGRSNSAVMALPHASHIPAAMASVFLEDMQQEYAAAYSDVGGRGTLLRARRSDDVIDCMMRAAHHGNVVGGALLLMVSMDLHHPDLNSSRNRAWSIIAAEKEDGRHGASFDSGRFKAIWDEARCIAPLHGAYTLMRQILPPVLLARAVSSPDGVRMIIGWAKWFRAWVVGFKPKHGRSPLSRII